MCRGIQVETLQTPLNITRIKVKDQDFTRHVKLKSGLSFIGADLSKSNQRHTAGWIIDPLPLPSTILE